MGEGENISEATVSVASVKVPKLGGVYRGDGESWETYARRLEMRIKEQRDLLQHLNSLKAEWADRHDRRRIVRMERALGRVTEKWQYEREARVSLVEKVKELERALRKIRDIGGDDLSPDECVRTLALARGFAARMLGATVTGGSLAAEIEALALTQPTLSAPKSSPSSEVSDG